MVRTSDLVFGRSRVRFIVDWGTKIFVALGEHSFSLFQKKNTPWSIRVAQ